jgi:hypothetical protein
MLPRYLDVAVICILQHMGLGVSVYGLFDSGRFEGWIDGHALEVCSLPSETIDDDMQTQDLHDRLTSQQIARQLAHFHDLSLPLKKDASWLHDGISKYELRAG